MAARSGHPTAAQIGSSNAVEPGQKIKLDLSKAETRLTMSADLLTI